MVELNTDGVYERPHFQTAFGDLLSTIKRSDSNTGIIKISTEQRIGLRYLETCLDRALCLEILRRTWSDDFSVERLDPENMEFKGQKIIKYLKIELKTEVSADGDQGRHFGKNVYEAHFEIQKKKSVCVLQ